jgi:hypothetical protein
MAKYSKGSQNKVEKVMHEFKEGLGLLFTAGPTLKNPKNASRNLPKTIA